MKVAVTGGAGFIGSHVVDRLMAAGHDVVVLDVRSPHRADVRFEAVDILDVRAMTTALVGCDVVFHLAGVADVNQAAADSSRTAELNVVGTCRVWEAARQAGVRRAVLASTVWVYAAAAGEGPVDEDAAFEPGRAAHVYTSSKLAAELVVHSCRELYGQEFTILRYGIPYGPRMRDELVIPRFVAAAMNGEAITVHGDGSQYRRYVYVEDLAEAHVLALSDVAVDGVFNLEGSEAVTVRRLVESITELAPGHVSVEYHAARPGDYAGRAVSAERAGAVLGWRPTVSFAEGLRRYVDWYVDTTPARTAAATPARTAAATPAPPATRRRRPALAPAAAALALPALVLHGHTPGAIGLRAAGSLLAVAAARGIRRLGPRGGPSLLGVCVALVSIWLLAQAHGAVGLSVAVLLGAGVALVAPALAPTAGGARPTGGVPVAATAAALVVMVGLAAAGRPTVVPWVAAALVVVSVRGAAADWLGPLLVDRRPSLGLGGALVVATGLAVCVVGATTASATWFGSPITHGPRRSAQVALTFDAANANATVAIARALRDEGVAATFFMLGEDVHADPSVARAVLASDQIVGNASYDRNPLQLLDMGLGRAGRAERTFHQQLDVCPTFFRPPRGHHTPFLDWALRHNRMAMVTWDRAVTVEGSTTAGSLASQVLERVRRGSILRIDVTGGAARRGDVAADAMPAIVDGLRSRGLEPVALDELLDRPAYHGRC